MYHDVHVIWFVPVGCSMMFMLFGLPFLLFVFVLASKTMRLKVLSQTIHLKQEENFFEKFQVMSIIWYLPVTTKV